MSSTCTDCAIKSHQIREMHKQMDRGNTELARLRAELEASQARLRRAVEAMSSPLWIENLIGDVYRNHRDEIRRAFSQYVTDIARAALAEVEPDKRAAALAAK